MAIIYFRVLSIPDAEDAIAETWNILEEYDIPSPDMTFSFRGSSLVKITLRVDDAVDAQSLMLHLAPWVLSQAGGMALSRKCGPRDARTFADQAFRHRAFSTQVKIRADGVTPPFGSTAIRLS